MPEIINNSTLTNNKIETGVTKNGKNFLTPRVQSPSVQPSRVQAPSCPESKRPIAQSPKVQSPSIQIQASRPHAQSPAFPVYLFKRCIQFSMLFIATGFVKLFCNRVETSLSCLFIQLTN